jgi:hypothetical protein
LSPRYRTLAKPKTRLMTPIACSTFARTLNPPTPHYIMIVAAGGFCRGSLSCHTRARPARSERSGSIPSAFPDNRPAFPYRRPPTWLFSLPAVTRAMTSRSREERVA